MRTLRQCLLDADPVVLRVIATRWSIDPTGLKPRELAAQVEAAIGDPARATQVVEALPPAGQDALRALLTAGGSLPPTNFTQRFGSIRAVGPARLEREQLWRNPISPAENLWYLGLIYRGFEQLPTGAMREVFFAPAELALLLPLLKMSESVAEPLPLATPPDQAQSSGEALADDLCTVLGYLHNNFVRMPGGSIRSVIEPLRSALAAPLRSGHPPRLEFLLRCAERAHLIKINGQRLRPDPKPSADWLRAPALDQLRMLFEAWRTDAAWHDLDKSGLLHVEKAVSLRNDPVAARTVLLDTLRAAVPNAWHTLDALLARVKAQSPDFLRSDFDTDYIRETATGEYLRGFAAWDRVEGALIRYLIGGPLFWLGMVEVDSLSPLRSFSLTTMGAAVLGMAVDQPVTQPPSNLFLVRADARIVVAASRRYDRFQLARVADLTGVVNDEYRYRLTPSSLTRAASQKITADKVIAFLTKAAGQDLPPTLTKAIQRWRGKGTEVKVEKTVIVRVKDAAILKRLQESPKTRGFAIEPLGPTAARINERDWPKLVAILAEAGVLVD